MDREKVVAAFFSGLATSPLVNTLFPIIVSLNFDNSASLPFLTKWVLRMIPFVLLLVLFMAVIDSTESFVAGVLGLMFSIAVFDGIGVSGLVTMVAVLTVAAVKIRNQIQ
ncbi:hypothetical protein [Haloprofundus salilacus]|uniref:hypothetical protein n=1 Tax=Haloprofundus salilacus TaxID=2876190 RepID=UPI001CCBF01F|nr:hypothetical protein [Haloprofundus salilacus]